MKYLPILISLLFFLLSCDNNGIEPSNRDPLANSTLVTLTPSRSYQSMIGFGGAISWYCDRVTRSSKKDEIIDVIVDDLGLDMLRLKNWYYPQNYPSNKETSQMEVSWFGIHFTATNELFDLVKAKNPDIKILFSSWGPPSALKSNGQLERGTLKKENDKFMYDEFATYWKDVMEHISFVPEYLSIQNEPTWLADWETCEWRAVETNNFPSYEIAFDKVSNQLSSMSMPPIMVGPESANLSSGAFDDFADELSDNPNLGVYGYHPYNFNNGSRLSNIQNTLAAVGNKYKNKPKFMTEYSGMDWVKTAQLINSTLREANTSAYLYWTLVWAEDSEDAMIKVDANGDYELTDFYYLVKHYSKFVDEGHIRIELEADNKVLDQVAFINPAGNEVVVISLNDDSEFEKMHFKIAGKTIKSIESFQSTEGTPWLSQSTEVGAAVTLRPTSVTTTILTLE